MVMLLAPGAASQASNLPVGFADHAVADVPWATAVAFVPGGRILVTSRLGQLYVQDGSATRLALDLNAIGRLCTDAERGLLGVDVDPAFTTSRRIHVYYTYRLNGNCGTDAFDASTQPVNRVSSFVLGNDDVVDPASEQVLIDNIPSPSGAHNGGDVQFGKDGYLYVTVGDGGCNYVSGGYCGPINTNARQPNVLLGKVLRITANGGVPPGNPFVGPGTSRCNVGGRTTSGNSCQETFASGLRNPFRLAFDPDASGTRFFVNDVGQDTWEEIDQGAAGADYGWNVREGPCTTGSTTDCGPPPAGITNPIHYYDHSGGCSSVTAGTFVPGGAWPSTYDSHYLYADFVCQKLFDLAPAQSGGFTVREFGQIASPVAMRFGPYGSGQALYYVSFAGDVSFSGGLRRIEYTGLPDRQPHASAAASPTSGPLPLQVNFDARQSGDPDGDALQFDWDFGDGSSHAKTAQAMHVYGTPGSYTATLTVSDGRGGSDTATAQIHAGSSAPAASIDSPAPDRQFGVGEPIALTGHATDPQDGALPDSALSWQVVKHHATHIHPFLAPTTGNNVQITGPPPEDLLAATNTYLEVRLTATNSRGVSTTVSQNIRPDLVPLSFQTEPPDLRVVVNGESSAALVSSWRNWRLDIAAPNQVDASGRGETFVSWSDSGAQTHTITTPAQKTTYVATFTPNYARPRGASPIRLSLVPAYRPCAVPNSLHGRPLASQSCVPPRPASPYATVGTPDANHRRAGSTGFVFLKAIVGNPSTASNEADIKIRASLGDVLDQTRSLSDYVGQLQAVVDVRLTDHLNGTAGTDTATTIDFPLQVTMPCVATAAPTGGACAANTTLNAVIPGRVTEGQHSVWQIGAVRVMDGGADGDVSTAGNSLFATQGVFVP